MLRAARPPQFKIGDQVRVTERGPLWLRGRHGVVVEINFNHVEHRLEFDDGHEPARAWVVRQWLELSRSWNCPASYLGET